MALTGTRVLSFMSCEGTSSVTALPFLYIVLLSMLSDMLVLPFLEVTVFVSPFHSTVAPKTSNIARSGTRVRPSIITGDWSKST